jgi:hypothetical protein
MRRSKAFIVLILLVCGYCLKAQQTNNIQWTDSIVINDEPVFTDKGVVSEAGGTRGRSHGKYGSQYARLLQCRDGAWLAGYTVSRNNGYRKDPEGGLQIEVAYSTNKGKTWKGISLITDPGRDVDNAQLIECPDGSILLACRSVRWQESYRLTVYKSTDKGKHWKLLSTIDANEGKPGELGKPDKGIYEPHFLLLDDGRLSVMYANEKHVTEQPAYSQVISQKISADMGSTWGKEIWVAFDSASPASRPGMPVWTKMKDGRFIVVYEICGPQKCNVYYKISADGIDWPKGLGTAIPAQLGGPYILSLADGTLVVSSNSAAVSISNDYGNSWKQVSRAWERNLWVSIYELAPGKIGLVNSVFRSVGGNNIQVRIGEVFQGK